MDVVGLFPNKSELVDYYKSGNIADSQCDGDDEEKRDGTQLAATPSRSLIKIMRRNEMLIGMKGGVAAKLTPYDRRTQKKGNCSSDRRAYTLEELNDIVGNVRNRITVNMLDVELGVHGLSRSGYKAAKAQRLLDHYAECHSLNIEPLDLSGMPTFDCLTLPLL